MSKVAYIFGGLFCLFSVVLGAFAAHGLKAHLSEYALSIFNTASTYQMYHGLALILIGLLIEKGLILKVTVLSFILGVLFFSGSLYILALTGIKWLGMITPIGGTLFIFGWCIFITKVARGRESQLAER
ncbi:COG2363 [Pseudoalteromonas luteoviolacea B = ATCC 29581]|nr:COG2363 [Pseudoalteromonas luteoviolacea B = ATCC 29581]